MTSASQFDEARWGAIERSARQRLESCCDDVEALTLLAISLHRRGNATEAASTYATLTARVPRESAHWSNYAAALRECGRLEEAAGAYETAIDLAPLDAGCWIDYALLLFHQNKYAEAYDAAMRARALDPVAPEIAIHAARVCTACREYDEAERLLRPWRNWLPLEDDLQQQLAELLLAASDGAAAVFVLTAIVRRSPDCIAARVRLASTYERLNRVAEAEAVLASIAALPHFLRDACRPELAHVLARIAMRNGDCDAAGAILASAGPRNERDAAHWFSRAEIDVRRANADGAMALLKTAHDVQARELAAFVPQRFSPGAHPLPLAERRVHPDEYAQWTRLDAPDAPQSPVFIVGFPRSGTTLLEQMLDAHPALQSMDENPFFNVLSDQLAEQDIVVPRDIARLGQADCDELRRRYFAMARVAIGRSSDGRIVDKNPLNLLWLPLIHRLFPNARFLLALRHPCDVILSCYMQNFRAAVLAAACVNLERLARAYVSAMESWLHHAALFVPSVLAVRNEDIVADFRAQCDAIGRFIGLDDAAPLAGFEQHARNKGFIGTPSYSQVVQPINDRGVGRWLGYRKYIDPLLPILAPMLQHWGYTA